MRSSSLRVISRTKYERSGFVKSNVSNFKRVREPNNLFNIVAIGPLNEAYEGDFPSFLREQVPYYIPFCYGFVKGCASMSRKCVQALPHKRHPVD